jgi:hypothetical protein
MTLKKWIIECAIAPQFNYNAKIVTKLKLVLCSPFAIR